MAEKRHFQDYAQIWVSIINSHLYSHKTDWDLLITQLLITNIVLCIIPPICTGISKVNSTFCIYLCYKWPLSMVLPLYLAIWSHIMAIFLSKSISVPCWSLKLWSKVLFHADIPIYWRKNGYKGLFSHIFRPPIFSSISQLILTQNGKTDIPPFRGPKKYL